VDLFLLCVAADDGVMPQTREHMAVLRGLGVTEGVVAVTKADTGDPDLAAEEAAELVPGAPVVRVSALRRTGLDDLLAALGDVAARQRGRVDETGPARLHLDRSFTLHGIGTVVTGTLWTGSIAAGDAVTVLPRGLDARVRSVQVHDRPVERAAAGQRVALNLAGPGWRELGRGDVVVPRGAELPVSYRLDVELDAPVEADVRVQVHHGTREAPARVAPLGEGFAQLRLEAPLVALAGDRVILRRIAPPDTIGGGTVVEAAARRHGASSAVVERLRALQRGDAPQPEPEPEPDVAEPEPEPLGDSDLALAALLRSEGTAPRAHGDLATALGIDAGELARSLRRLEGAGQAVRVARNLHFHSDPLAELEGRVVALCERDGQATIAALRDELGTSRRYAQALLEHLDRTKVTRRDGDVHVLRRRR
jgi:selenocysteine-specific elongation factor